MFAVGLKKIYQYVASINCLHSVRNSLEEDLKCWDVFICERESENQNPTYNHRTNLASNIQKKFGYNFQSWDIRFGIYWIESQKLVTQS